MNIDQTRTNHSRKRLLTNFKDSKRIGDIKRERGQKESSPLHLNHFFDDYIEHFVIVG